MQATISIEQKTQAAAQKATSSGTFKIIKDEACKEQDILSCNIKEKIKSLGITGENLESLMIKFGTNNTGETSKSLMLKLKVSNVSENSESLILKLLTNSSSETETNVSICSDSGIDEIKSGIVGILEGFGLLKTDSGQDVQAVLTNQLSENGSDVDAGMPELNQLEDYPAEVQTEIVKLVEKYLCSFANTNNSKVDTANSTDPDSQPQTKEIITKTQVKLIANKVLSTLKTKISIQQVPNVSSSKTGSQQGQGSQIDSSLKNTSVPSVQTIQFETEPETTDLKDTGLATSQDMAVNVERLVEKMSIKNLTGKQEFEVTLKPEYLGKVSIKLVMESDGIKAQIKTTNVSAKTLLGGQIPALQEALKDKGVNVSQIEVTYENPILDFNKRDSQGQNESGNGNKSKRFYVASETGIGSSAYDVLSDISNLIIENSSVEFQA